nr:MAG TPA: hypothetical protein [Bacteriophage sp.]
MYSRIRNASSNLILKLCLTITWICFSLSKSVYSTTCRLSNSLPTDSIFIVCLTSRSIFLFI